MDKMVAANRARATQIWPGYERSADGRSNNFGALRLLFALFVIAAHSAELVDGNRSREVLTNVFGTISFGEIGVDGFFLLSGYLIARSFVETSGPTAFLARRVLRIVPGFLVCFWLCVFCLVPFAGSAGSVFDTDLLTRNLWLSVTLRQPEVPGLFPGLPYPTLNGSLWTIAYEFRCYLYVALIGTVGRVLNLRLRTWRWFLLLIIAVAGYGNAVDLFHDVEGVWIPVLGTVQLNIHFTAIFGAGAMFYVFSDRLPLTERGAALAALFLSASLFYREMAEPGVSVFGGYLLFWLAFRCRVLPVWLSDQDTDISYGLYLYAWPVQNFVIWFHPRINPWAVCITTLALAGTAGYASWHVVERPAIGIARRNRHGRTMSGTVGAA